MADKDAAPTPEQVRRKAMMDAFDDAPIGHGDEQWIGFVAGWNAAERSSPSSAVARAGAPRFVQIAELPLDIYRYSEDESGSGHELICECPNAEIARLVLALLNASPEAPLPGQGASREHLADIICAGYDDLATDTREDLDNCMSRPEHLATADKIIAAFAPSPAGQGEAMRVAEKMEQRFLRDTVHMNDYSFGAARTAIAELVDAIRASAQPACGGDG